MGASAASLVVLRHIALNSLKQERTAKMGIKNMRLKASWDERYLLNSSLVEMRLPRAISWRDGRFRNFFRHHWPYVKRRYAFPAWARWTALAMRERTSRKTVSEVAKLSRTQVLPASPNIAPSFRPTFAVSRKNL